jgi:hypothetical protein
MSRKGIPLMAQSDSPAIMPAASAALCFLTELILPSEPVSILPPKYLLLLYKIFHKKTNVHCKKAKRPAFFKRAFGLTKITYGYSVLQ